MPAVFSPELTYVLGAPDVILGSLYGKYAEVIDAYSEKGCRVLLLAKYSGDVERMPLTGQIVPISLILLANKIRENAPETFRFFAEQGVDIKVSPETTALAALAGSRFAPESRAPRRIYRRADT